MLRTFSRLGSFRKPSSALHTSLSKLRSPKPFIPRIVVNRSFQTSLPRHSDDTFTQSLDKVIELHEKGKLDEAMQYYDKLISLKPEDSFSYMNRGLLHEVKCPFDRLLVYRVLKRIGPLPVEGCQGGLQQGHLSRS